MANCFSAVDFDNETELLLILLGFDEDVENWGKAKKSEKREEEKPPLMLISEAWWNSVIFS